SAERDRPPSAVDVPDIVSGACAPVATTGSAIVRTSAPVLMRCSSRKTAVDAEVRVAPPSPTRTTMTLVGARQVGALPDQVPVVGKGWVFGVMTEPLAGAASTWQAVGSQVGGTLFQWPFGLQLLVAEPVIEKPLAQL